MKSFRLIVLWICIVFIHACTKEGAVGPQGFDGLAGSKIFSGNSIPTTSIGIIGDYYFDTSSSDFYGPKTAEGWGNPVNLRGTTGAQGVTGATGPTGSKGQDGSKIIAATGIPILSIGNVGDFYINLSTSDLYGPRTNTSWGTAVNLKGANGANGTKILSGTAVPNSSLGSVGDYYFHTSNANLYGPKTAAGWGTPISLIGANGKDGSNGTNGSHGKTILHGTTVPATTIGTVGDFYYRTNTGDFYGPKTADGWGVATNLKGINGKDGAPGSQILSGTAVPDASLGRIGDFYFRTATGDFYGPKTATSWGNPVNLKGATGVNGSPGSKIHAGSSIPADTLGRAGDYYINISIGDLYGPKTTTWGSRIMNLRGPSNDVIYSQWLKVDGYDQSGGEAKIIIPLLSRFPEFLDNASLVIYAQEFKDSNFNTPLSIHQLNYYSQNFDCFINYRLDIDNVVVYQFNVGRFNAPLDEMLFRYVIIPGNIAVEKFGMKTPSNYNEFKKLYRIED